MKTKVNMWKQEDKNKCEVRKIELGNIHYIRDEPRLLRTCSITPAAIGRITVAYLGTRISSKRPVPADHLRILIFCFEQKCLLEIYGV